MTGNVTLGASGVAQKSGSPQRVTGITITSNGGGNGVVALRNGTSGSATILVQFTGVQSSAAAPANFPADGINFPAGLFVSLDTNTTSVTLTMEQLATV